jgi:hypothetical protein
MADECDLNRIINGCFARLASEGLIIISSFGPFNASAAPAATFMG